MRDPFSPEADPAREEEQAPPPVLGRRQVVVSLTVLPAAAAGLSACTALTPACPTHAPREGERCPHRFCRYHRG
jgi:hypothetical protein